jgi:mannosyltransferase
LTKSVIEANRGASEAAVYRILLYWVGPLLLLAGLFLRVKFAEQPLWIDELHTAWVVQNDWSDVSWRAAIGNQSPLYFYLVKISVEIFGFSPWSLRLISILAGTFQMAVLFVVLTRWTGAVAAGTIAACLLMVNPVMLFASTEARPYALSGLVACIQLPLLAEFWRLAAQGKDRYAGFDIVWLTSTVIMFYLHYTTLLWSAAVWIGLCWLAVTERPRPSAAQLTRWLLGMPLLAAFVAIPGLWHLASILPFGGQWSEFVRLDNYFIGLSSLLLVLVIGPLLAGLVVQLLYLLKPTQMWSLVQDYRWWPLLVLTLTALLLPPITAAVLTGWSIMPLAHWRYFAASVSAGFLVPGLTVGIWYWPRVRWLCATLLISLGLASNLDLLGVVWTGRWPVLRDEQWEEVSARIRAVTESRDMPVILCPGLIEDGWLVRELLPLTPDQRAKFRHYCIFALDGPHRIYDDPAKNQELVFARPTKPRLQISSAQAEQIQRAGGCFLVVRSLDPVLAKNLAKHIKFGMSNDEYPMRITELMPIPVSLFLIEYTGEPLPIIPASEEWWAAPTDEATE